MLRLVERLLGSTGVGEDRAPRELTEIETAARVARLHDRCSSSSR